MTKLFFRVQRQAKADEFDNWNPAHQAAIDRAGYVNQYGTSRKVRPIISH